MTAHGGSLRTLRALIPVVDEGLGNSACLLESGGRAGAGGGPVAGPRAVMNAARRERAGIAHAGETQLHADFLSGVRQLAHDGGARVLADEVDGRAILPPASSL